MKDHPSLERFISAGCMSLHTPFSGVQKSAVGVESDGEDEKMNK